MDGHRTTAVPALVHPGCANGGILPVVPAQLATAMPFLPAAAAAAAAATVRAVVLKSVAGEYCMNLLGCEVLEMLGNV